MKTLLDSRRFAEIQELSEFLILRQPANTDDVTYLMRSRIQAELKMGKTSDALGDAKRLYNVAPMPDMADAMKMVAQCLAAEHPNDLQLMKDFRSEQVAGYLNPGKKSAVLPAIVVSPQPYLDAIQHGSNSSSAAGEGNLLLLADKPSAACALFERAAHSARGERNHLENLAALARAMKAADGTIGAANAYLRHQLDLLP
jgi:hypothetical protein